MTAGTPNYDLEDLIEMERTFQDVINKSQKICVFDTSIVKSNTLIKQLNTLGYENIIEERKSALLKPLLKKNKLIKLVIMTADLKDDLSIKLYAKIMEDSELKNIPFIFISDKVLSSFEEIAYKLGAIDVMAKGFSDELLKSNLEKSFDYEEFKKKQAEEKRLAEEKRIELEKAENKCFKIDVREQADGTIARVKGPLNHNNLNQLVEVLMEIQYSETEECRLDISLVTVAEDSIADVIKNAAKGFSLSSKKMTVIDANNILKKLDFGENPSFHIVG